jgi:nucleoside 2-deoxyribosyltransferase
MYSKGSLADAALLIVDDNDIHSAACGESGYACAIKIPSPTTETARLPTGQLSNKRPWARRTGVLV